MYIRRPHSAMIVGATGCGKTEFVLDLLENEYKDFFENIVILCPSIEFNRAYKNRTWIGEDVGRPKASGVTVVNPVSKNGEEKLQEMLRHFYEKYKGSSTLYIIDDCSATKQMKKKTDALSMLAFSGRHADQSVWILTQRYNSACKDFRTQVKWVCLFFTKDKFSYHECLDENDVIATREEKREMKEKLSRLKHSKLILFTEQPTGYEFKE